MNHTKTITTLTILTLTLTGCGNPVSVGTGSEQSQSTAFESGLSYIKKIGRSFTTKATVQMPASALIAEALLDNEFQIKNKQQILHMGNPDGRLLPIVMAEIARQTGEEFEPAATQLVSEPDKSGGAMWMNLVAASVSPFMGWPVNPMSNRQRDRTEVEFFLKYQEASVEFTNAVFTKIASQIDGDVLEDPETAKAEIQKIYLSIPQGQLQDIWKLALHNTTQRDRLIDMTGVKGVSWNSSGATFTGDEAGMNWVKNGVVWFGKGALSGKTWTVGLENSFSKSSEKSNGGSTKNGGTTSSKTSEQTQVK